jgi:hypothetical protein
LAAKVKVLQQKGQEGALVIVICGGREEKEILFSFSATKFQIGSF